MDDSLIIVKLSTAAGSVRRAYSLPVLWEIIGRGLLVVSRLGLVLSDRAREALLEDHLDETLNPRCYCQELHLDYSGRQSIRGVPRTRAFHEEKVVGWNSVIPSSGLALRSRQGCLTRICGVFWRLLLVGASTCRGLTRDIESRLKIQLLLRVSSRRPR